jgi:murein L,D-transpeptidase YcbB/YkuD
VKALYILACSVLSFTVLTGTAFAEAAGRWTVVHDDESDQPVMMDAEKTSQFFTSPRGFERDISQAMHNILKSSTIKLGNASLSTKDIKAFYKERAYLPAWITPDGLNKQALEILEQLGHAHEDGLNPADYYLSDIDALRLVKTPEDQATLELLISAAVTRYADHVRYGRTTPGHEDKLTQKHTVHDIDFTQLLTDASETGEIADMAPDTEEYKLLKAGLKAHYALLDQGGLEHYPHEGEPLEPGQYDGRVTVLRQILLKLGDLQNNRRMQQGRYDYALMKAVQNFQKRHGLYDDGIIGPETIEALNMSIEQRIGEIAATMERIRWLPRDLGKRYILVNIPGYYLKAMNEGEKELEMKVIIGKPYRKTPLFSNRIENVVFSPTWGVPTSIAGADMLPRIKKDPEFLKKSGFTLSYTNPEEGIEERVNAEEIDWEEMDAQTFSANYRMRQRPGDDNALGRVKFLMPNSSSIYLHGTSHPQLFENTERDLSSGCIRVEYPKELAHFVMEGNPEWTIERIDTTYEESTSPLTVTLKRPVPVHTVYWTAWPDDDGMLHFSRDIYQKNGSLVAQLLPRIKKNVELAGR